MNNHQPFNTVGEQGYLDLLQHILDNGYKSGKERTGTGTIVSPTPHQLYFPDVGKQFPLFTTKEVSFNMLACEMLWFISGSTNTNDLEKIGSPAMKKMWDKWADEDGELGPVYGKQWRFWKDWYNLEDNEELFQDAEHDYYLKANYIEIDQLQNVIDGIKENPESRRHIVSAWNPADIDDMALPPCHMTFQFTCEPLTNLERIDILGGMEKEIEFPSKIRECDEKGVPNYKLHLHLLQRSCDAFLGVPFNIAQYALLLIMVSKVTNTVAGNFTWTGVNCHIYQNHTDAVKEQLSRDIKNPPSVHLYKGIKNIDDFEIGDITLENYNHHPKIEAEVSV